MLFRRSDSDNWLRLRIVTINVYLALDYPLGEAFPKLADHAVIPQKMAAMLLQQHNE